MPQDLEGSLFVGGWGRKVPIIIYTVPTLYQFSPITFYIFKFLLKH